MTDTINPFAGFDVEQAESSAAVAQEVEQRQIDQLTGGLDLNALIAEAEAEEKLEMRMNEPPEMKQPIDDVDDDKLSAWQDVPLQMVGGLRDAAQSVKNLGVEIGSVLATPLQAALGADAEEREAIKQRQLGIQIPDVPEPDTTAGAIARPITQFAVPFGALGKTTEGIKKFKQLEKFEPFLRGIVTDFVAFEGHEERLSDAIAKTDARKVPVVGAIANYLKSDVDDGEFEGRMKNAIEGAALGGLGDALFKSVKYVKQARDFKKIKGDHVKDGAKAARKAASDAKKIRNQDLDDVDLNIERPNQEKISIETQRKLAETVGATLDDFMAGTQFKDIRSKEIMNIMNKGTILQEEQFLKTREVAQNAVKLMEKGDTKEAKRFITENLVPYLQVDAAMKDTAQDLARAQGFRSQTEGVVEANKFLNILQEADTIDAEAIVRAFADVEDQGVFSEMANAVAKRGRATTDIITEVYRNFILSSPRTLAVDTLGSAAWFTFRTAEKIPAAVVSKIRRGFFKGDPDGVEFREAAIMANAMTESFVDGIRFIGHVARDIDPDRGILGNVTDAGRKIGAKIDEIKVDNSTRFDAPVSETSIQIDPDSALGQTPYATAVRYFSNVVNTPLRFMGAKDDIAKSMYYKADLKSRAYRQAVKEGLEGEALAARRLELEKAGELTSINAPLENNPAAAFLEALTDDTRAVGQSISNKAVQAAKEATFTDDLGSTAKAFQTAINKTAIGEIIFPFIKTPTKLLWDRFLMERTPLGILGKKFRAEIAAGGARADEAIGQLATGSMLMYVAWNMAQNGQITGEGPTDKAGRDALLRTGWRPRSIKVGDEYIEIGRLDPIASLFVFPATMVEFMHERDNHVRAEDKLSIEDAMIMNAQAFARMTASKSWLASAGQLIDAINSERPDRVKRLVNFYGASMTVPNAVTFAMNEVNSDLQMADTLTGEIRKRLGFGDFTRRDVFGDTVKRDPQIIPGVIPLGYSGVVDDPLMHKLVDMGANLRMPSYEVEGVEITMAEHQRMMDILKEIGVKDAIRDVVDEVFESDLPRTARTGVEGAQSLTQSGLVRSVYNDYVREARLRLIDESPDLQERIRKMDNLLATQETAAPLGAPVTGDAIPSFSPTGQQ